MKVQIKGKHIPTAHVGSKDYRFSKGSQGVKVKELADLGEWRREGEMWAAISKDNREQILQSVRQWIESKEAVTIEIEIDHSWKKVAEAQQASQDAYAKSTLKLKTDWQNDPRYGFAE